MMAVRERTFTAVSERQRAVWLVAVLAYGFGDLLTTVAGLTFGGAAEGGPLASLALTRWGLLGIVALKVAIVLGFYVLWQTMRTPSRVAVPLALAVVGVGVTLWNLAVLY